MKRHNHLLSIILLFFFGLLLLTTAAHAKQPVRNLVVTTFPIYQIVKNVVQGRDDISVELMIPSTAGCPHDYALTPQDMQKLAKAHILIVNGLGLEEFLGAPVEKANPKIHLLDSSTGIDDLIHREEDHEESQEHAKETAAEHHHGHKDTHHEGHAHDDHGKEAVAEHDDEHHHDHDHSGPNPHLFVSPTLNGALAMNIAAGLSKFDPAGAGLYFQNANQYKDSMKALSQEMTLLGKRLKNNRIVQPHGVFDYLARDMGLEIVANLSEHGQEPSASEMVELVKVIKEKNTGAIFTEPQYPEKIGHTLSQETGVPVAMLDPVATGPDNAPLDYFEKTMRSNMTTLESVLGVHY